MHVETLRPPQKQGEESVLVHATSCTELLPSMLIGDSGWERPMRMVPKQSCHI